MSQFLPGTNRSNTEMFSYSANRGYKASLHSGYVQALADLGFAGFVLYTVLILMTLFASVALRHDKFTYPFSFICLYLAICNLSENVILSPTSSFTLFFWLSWFVLAMEWRCNKAAKAEFFR